MTENESVRYREIPHDLRDVVRQLHDGRIRGRERRLQREAGKVDHMNRPTEAAQRADLWCERAPVRHEPGEHDRVRWRSAAPGGDAEPVAIAWCDVHPHVSKTCNWHAFARSPVRGVERRLRQC